MAKKTLYRLVWGHDYSKGTPCVPCIPLGTVGEDEKTPRICVANTVSGCLTSIGAAYIGELGITKVISSIRATDPNAPLDMERAWRSSVYPFTILEFDVEPEDPMILSPEQISNVVLDAAICGEHWILNERVPNRVKKVWLQSATTKDVAVRLSNGYPARIIVFSYDQWSNKKTRPTLSLLRSLNLAFVKIMKQYKKHGYDLPEDPYEQY